MKLRTILAATVAAIAVSPAAFAQGAPEGYWSGVEAQNQNQDQRQQQSQAQGQRQAGEELGSQTQYRERLRADPHMQNGQAMRTAPFLGPESTRTVNGQTDVAQAREEQNFQDQQGRQTQQGGQNQQWTQGFQGQQQWNQGQQGFQGQQPQGQQQWAQGGQGFQGQQQPQGQQQWAQGGQGFQGQQQPQGQQQWTQGGQGFQGQQQPQGQQQWTQGQQGFQGQQQPQGQQQWTQGQQGFQGQQQPQGQQQWAQGQQRQGQQQGQMAMQQQLDMQRLQGGFTGENLLDADVIDAQGEDIGDVDNVLIGPDDQIVAIIAEVGGFWGIGATHVAVPWNEVRVTNEGIQIPVTEENVEDYSVFRDESYFSMHDVGQIGIVEDDPDTGPRIWKLNELVGDYAALRTGTGFGYVDDVLFTPEGKLEGVVVTPDYRVGLAGRYAYPFHGYGVGWAPRYTYYQLPYDQTQVAEVEEFDEEALNSPLAD